MADGKKIKIRGGLLSELRSITLDIRETGVTTDTKEFFVGSTDGNKNLVDRSQIYMPVNYSDKESGVNFFKNTSGLAVISYDPSESAMGKGCFSVPVNGGTFELERFYPVSPLFGIGGHIAIKGIGLFEVGVDFYDADFNPIPATSAQQNFLVDSVVGGTSFGAYKNYLIDEGVGDNNFPVGTRFIKPRVTVTSNATPVKFDSFIIYPSSFSILSLYA